MIRIGLERFFELPIIPAPKRNSKLHSEMWTNSFLPRAFSAHGHECATLHEALTSDTPVSCDGQAPRSPRIATTCPSVSERANDVAITGGGNRTHTGVPAQRILSPQRLPFRHAGAIGARRALTNCKFISESIAAEILKRRGWDSNPRMACTIYGFQDRPDRPLWHPSSEILQIKRSAGREQDAPQVIPPG